MKQPHTAEKSEGSAVVTLVEERIIICRLKGGIAGPTVKESVRQTKEYADLVRARHMKPLLLIDITGITSQSSEARSNAKMLSTCGLQRIAVYGKNRALIMVGRYLARAAGLGDQTRFFPTEARAMQWLRRGELVSRGRTTFNIVMGLLVTALIALIALAGWQWDMAALRAIVPSFKPMNPVTAITLLAIVAAMIYLLRSKPASPWRRWIVRGIVGWPVIFGALVLVRYFWQVDIPIDTWLYGEKLDVMQPSGRVAPGSAILILLLGLKLWLMLAGQHRPWQRRAFDALGILIVIGTCSSILGYAFGLGRYHLFDAFISIPLNTACALLLLLYVMHARATKGRSGGTLFLRYQSNWQAVWMFGVLLFATGIIWQQTINDINKTVQAISGEAFIKAEDTIAARLGAYNDALYGYRGLFAASTLVAPEEFHQYFRTSDLSARYSGFTSITFIARVPAAEKQTFTARTRAFASSQYQNYKDFTIFPMTGRSVYYPAVYSAPYNPTTRYGFDLGSENTRLTTLEKARDTGQAAASGIINLNASRGANQPERKGFFISVPLYSNTPNGGEPGSVQERRNRHAGFVAAYFQNDLLFADLFKHFNQANARYVITDMSTGKQLYASSLLKTGEESRVLASAAMEVFGQDWRLDMIASPYTGTTALQRALPDAVLISGLTLSLLAGALVLGQLRRRDQALQLAAEMTEDLNNERNKAVAIQRKNEAVLASIGDAVFAIDTEQRITHLNPAAEAISGYGAQEAIGKPYKEILQFLYEKDGRINDGFIRHALKGHTASMEANTVLVRKDGQRVAVADSAAPIHDSRGVLQGVIVVFRDVSKEQELDRAKTEFVSLASHQLRTPLAAINWYAELLLSGDTGKIPPSQKKYLQEIYEGNQRMIELVSALLDVSRLDLGKLTNQPVAVDLIELAASLEKELATAIAKQKLMFIKKIAPGLPAVVADPKLLRMIVQNLFSNAVKYTPTKGSVELTMRRAESADLQKAGLSQRGREYVLLSIKDTGYGIPKAQQKKIFSKLFRADNVRALDVEGTGLGLYIVKEVSEKLGGRVWFVSEEGKGSAFYVILPVHTQAYKSHLD